MNDVEQEGHSKFSVSSLQERRGGLIIFKKEKKGSNKNKSSNKEHVQISGPD